MKKIPLPNEVKAATGFNECIQITHEDITEVTANTAQVIALLTVEAGDLVRICATLVKRVWKDVSDAAFNTTAITIGDGGSANRFLASQELNENGTEVLYKGGANTTPFAYTTADTIDITFNAMAAKSLSDIDQGELLVFLGVTRMGALNAQLPLEAP